MALPSEFEKVPYLWSGNNAPKESYDYRLDKLMRLVVERKDRADGLVMVTHAEVAEDFPSYFLINEFKQDKSIGEISKGQAVYFDLEKRTYQIIPR